MHRKEIKYDKTRRVFLHDAPRLREETSGSTIYMLFRSHYTFCGLPKGHANEFRCTCSMSSKCSMRRIANCIRNDAMHHYGCRGAIRDTRGKIPFRGRFLMGNVAVQLRACIMIFFKRNRAKHRFLSITLFPVRNVTRYRLVYIIILFKWNFTKYRLALQHFCNFGSILITE